MHPLAPVRNLSLAFSIYHVALGALGFGLLLLYARLRDGPPLRRWLALAALGTVFGAAALVGAAALTMIHRWGSGFLFMRFLSQALFGELPLVLAALAVLHWRRRDRGSAAGFTLGLVALLGVYTDAYHLEPHNLQIRTHAVDLTAGRPRRGVLRVVHLSDIQTHQVGRHERAAIRQASALRPDLVVLTGDYVHARPGTSRQRALRDLKALLAGEGFGAPLGVFAVRGDVDTDWPEPLQGLGFHLLADQVVDVRLPGGPTLAVIGLGPRDTHRSSPRALQRLLEQARHADLRLVAGHAPDFVLALGGDLHADLSLAGHTHGGQVALPFFGPPLTLSRLPRRYASGLHTMNGGWLHVSAGVGMERGVAPQVRFLVPPEVCLLEVAY